MLHHVVESVQKDLREAFSEETSVEVCGGVHLALSIQTLTHVNFITLRTKQFHPSLPESLAKSHRNTFLAVTQSSRTHPKFPFKKLMEHFRKSYIIKINPFKEQRLTIRSRDIPLMYEPVNVDNILQEIKVLVVCHMLFQRGLSFIEMLNKLLKLFLFNRGVKISTKLLPDAD